MSGIAGIIHFDGRPVEPGLIEKMTGAMAHRGPDGINHWVNGSVALGQCMLRTTPESLEEHQPLANEDESLVLVMDGRVDNWEELRRDLLGCGAVLRNRSDAELVLKAYEVWEQDCPRRIIGEFVFFIWNLQERLLFGARDAVGTRHFYYYEGKSWFGFSSEIKGLLAYDAVEQRMNESRLLDYLVVQFDRDDEVGTFYKGINRLPAGHAVVVSEDGRKSWRYWDPSSLPAITFSSQNECAEAFLEHFRTAVKCRLRTTGRVGAMLSGGLDSSSIVGLISKEFREFLPQPLKTFSLIRKDCENCSDWQFIKEILKDGWIDSTIVTSDIAAQNFHLYYDSIKDLDEPFDFTNGFTDSLIYKAASVNECQVVLDGMAGDLLFYSPARSATAIVRQKLHKLILPYIVSCKTNGLGLKYGLKLITRRLLSGVTPERLKALHHSIWRNNELVRNDLNKIPGNLIKLLHLDTAEKFIKVKRRKRKESGLFNFESDQKSHSQYFTTGLLSFAHEVNGLAAFSEGVEPRSPLSDRRLIEFAVQMPPAAKLSTPCHKFLFRKCMEGYLPDDVRWRNKSGGGHPGWKFFEQFLLEMALTVPDMWSCSCLEDKLQRWINSSKLNQSWYYYDNSKDYETGFNLFILVVLAEWLEKRQHLLVAND